VDSAFTGKAAGKHGKNLWKSVIYQVQWCAAYASLSDHIEFNKDKHGENMESSNFSLRQAHRLVLAGMFLFLLSLLIGLVIPLFAVPRLGLSAHLLGILQGIFLIIIGMLWPKLMLSRAISQFVFWLFIYGCFSAWSANVLAGIWGAGNTMLPIAAGSAHGTSIQEIIIMIVLRSAAISLITAVIFIIWGLQTSKKNQPNE
jgi:hydroxylaminobenzene mutase